MARLLWIAAAAPLLILLACAIPVAESSPAVSEDTAPVQVEVLRQHRPALFSDAYLDAIRDVLQFEPKDVEAFERSVAGSPRDSTTRLKILAYANRADQIGRAENLKRRKEQVYWLLEHDPGSEILASHLGQFRMEELSAQELGRAKTLWQSAFEAQPTNARMLANAAKFFEPLDRELRRRYLELAAAAMPVNANYGAELGILYAEAIIRPMRDATPETLRLASEAERILEASGNAAMVETAVHVLTSQANVLSPRVRADSRVAKVASLLYPRAKALNPDVDDAWLRPQPAVPDDRFHDPPTAEELAAARARVVRLSPSDFPELPDAIAKLLTGRDCGIPQISHAQTKMNLIRGEFFTAGEAGWAVICSSSGLSQILVFRNDSHLQPLLLEEYPDSICLAEEWTCGSYQTAIGVADRDFIMTHYRAYGGPEPPPIDHQGIDVAYVEKASVVRYFHEGEWLRLTGAD